MYVTQLEHEGHIWTVELRRSAELGGTEVLEFVFSRTEPSGGTVCLPWHVSGESLEAISEHGLDVGEDLPRRYLRLALAEARTIDATGVAPVSKAVLSGGRE